MSRSTFAAATVLSVAIAFQIVPAPAQAAPGDLVCGVNTTTTYNPPLTNSDQTVEFQVTSLYFACDSASHPDIATGLASAAGTITSSCLRLNGAGTFMQTITWNTGQTSTVTANINTTIAGAAIVVLITGVFTDGVFDGVSVTSNRTGSNPDIPKCELGLGTVSNISTLGTVTSL